MNRSLNLTGARICRDAFILLGCLLISGGVGAQPAGRTPSSKLATLAVEKPSTRTGVPKSADEKPTGSEALQAVYINSKDVQAGFAKSAIIFDQKGSDHSFSVHTTRRAAPGLAEIHALDTDIVYVVEGSATIVTGGHLVNPRTTAPNQTRGDSIEGGESQVLSKGDVIIVPNGLPHWFKETQGTFLYFLVKYR